MKLFQVKVETDGATRKVDGGQSTEIVCETFYYAAMSFEAVWERGIKWLRDDPERQLVLIAEVAPMVSVIPEVVERETS